MSWLTAGARDTRHGFMLSACTGRGSSHCVARFLSLCSPCWASVPHLCCFGASVRAAPACHEGAVSRDGRVALAERSQLMQQETGSPASAEQASYHHGNVALTRRLCSQNMNSGYPASYDAEGLLQRSISTSGVSPCFWKRSLQFRCVPCYGTPLTQSHCHMRSSLWLFLI